MKPLLTVLFTYLSLSLAAQVMVYDGNSFTIDEIDDETVDHLIETVTNAIQNYGSWATMLDANNQAVTSKSLKNFKSLFERNAKVVDDLSLESNKMHYADYAGKVLEFLEEEGVRFNMYGALIDQIAYDSTGYYEVDVITEKYLYNGLEDNNKRFYCRNGRIFRLKFTFSIPEDDLDIAKILQIKGQLARDCEDKVPVFHIGLQTGTTFFKNTESEIFETNFPELDWTTIPTLQFGFDVDLQYPLDGKDRIFFILGANFRQYKLSNRFSGVYHTPLEEGIGVESVQFTKLEEDIKSMTIEVPLGLRVNILNKDPLYIFADALFSANIPVYTRGTFDANIVYSKTINDVIMIDERSLNNGVITPYSIPAEGEELALIPDVKTNYAVQFGPTFQYILGQSFAFQVDIKYKYGLSSWFNHKKENFFVGQTDDDVWLGGLSQIYASRAKVNSFGIHLGVIYKKRW